jgi:hypothetical protein
MVTILADLALRPGGGHQAHNLRLCYEALVGKGFFPKDELALLDAWLKDLEQR